MTTSLVDNNIKNEQGGQYDTEIVAVFMILINASVFMLLLFVDAVWKLLALMQRLVKLFFKVNVLLGNKNIEREWGGKYDTTIVTLLLHLFAASVQY